MNINIIEAYIKFNSQLIIVISNFPYCEKKIVYNAIANALKFKIVYQSDYIKEQLKEINWDEFNEAVNSEKQNGIIVVASLLDNSKINFKVDYNIQVSLNKNSIIDLLTKSDQFEKQLDDLKQFVNQTLYPAHLASVKNSTINKFINGNIIDDDTLEDYIWDSIIMFVKNSLQKK